MTTQSINRDVGLLPINELNLLFARFTDFFKKYNYINDNENYTFNNSLCICNIQKLSDPNWITELYIPFITQDNKNKNTTHYRIIFYKYCNNSYYLEINGNIKLDKILKECNFEKFNKTLWNKSYIKIKDTSVNELNKLNEYIHSYCYNNLQNNIIEDAKKLNINIDTYIKDAEYTVNHFLTLYNNIPKLYNNMQLIPYNKKDCYDSNNKSSETKYNKLVCNNNPSRYIYVDTKYIFGCEIADIYDIENNLLFHNKKNKDLRVLSAQVFIGALLLKTTDECKDYIEKYKIKNTTDISYVFGVIKEKKTELSYKDKIALGNACFILNKLEIKYYIDEIQYIDDKTQSN